MTKTIYLAGGCFWGTEHYLKMVNGVVNTEVGFANGHTENPSYKEVCTDKTGFAETVKVEYDQNVLPLSKLLDIFFKAIDPTSLNKQGHDIGTQYRTGIYYVDLEDKKIIDEAVGNLAKLYTKSIALEVLPLKNFYNAEDYHQDYLDKNPTGYCHLSQDLFIFAKKAN
jgi:peptide methionine sulfoxide reductase msrA/msrB